MSYLPNRRRSTLWDPFVTLREIDSAMSRWGSDWNSQASSGLHAFAMDVIDEPNRYIVHLNAPGIDRKDLEISFENGTLSFQVNQNQEREDRGDTYLLRERSVTNCSRAVSLPLADTSGSKIDASLKDGVLSVIVPKQPEKTTRKVEIR